MSPETFGAILRYANEGEKQTRTLSRSARGPAQLLELQIAVYRYSEAIELSARVVDRLAQAAKTVLQSQ